LLFLLRQLVQAAVQFVFLEMISVVESEAPQIALACVHDLYISVVVLVVAGLRLTVAVLPHRAAIGQFLAQVVLQLYVLVATDAVTADVCFVCALALILLVDMAIPVRVVVKILQAVGLIELVE
jgi:hypothetical protein